MSAGSYCHITIPADPKAWFTVEAGFNPEFSQIIKSLPYYQRHYNPTDSSWTIAPEYQDYLISQAQKHFNRVIIISSGRAVEYGGCANGETEIRGKMESES